MVRQSLVQCPKCGHVFYADKNLEDSIKLSISRGNDTAYAIAKNLSRKQSGVQVMLDYLETKGVIDKYRKGDADAYRIR